MDTLKIHDLTNHKHVAIGKQVNRPNSHPISNLENILLLSIDTKL